MDTCEMTVNHVLEVDQRLELVRSGNVFAVGLERENSGLLVHFIGSRWPGTMYVYRGATKDDLHQVLAADSASAAVRSLDAKVGGGELLDVTLIEALDEAWGICESCKALTPDEWCPECGASTPADYAVDRCPVCRTYVVSVNGGAPLGRTCSGWEAVSQ